jgi:hypothetical protein
MASDHTEVTGMEQLVREDPVRGVPVAWLPGIGEAPTEFELTMRYNGREYHAYLAGTREAAARFGTFQRGERWAGWEVKVTDTPDPRGGGQSTGPFPTLEAAIVSALTAPMVIDYWNRQHEAERRQRERDGS